MYKSDRSHRFWFRWLLLLLFYSVIAVPPWNLKVICLSVCSGNLAEQFNMLNGKTFAEVRTQRKKCKRLWRYVCCNRASSHDYGNKSLTKRISIPDKRKNQKRFIIWRNSRKPYFMRFSGIEKSTVILSELRWIYGGAEENRTPVRKPIRQPFYTLSEVFWNSLSPLRLTG